MHQIRQKTKNKSIIADKAKKILDTFPQEAKTSGIHDDIIKEVVDHYYYDQRIFKIFPKEYEFKLVSKENITDDYDKAYYLLAHKLLTGYTNLNSQIKARYRAEYFSDKIYRCPMCGQLLETSGASNIPTADLDHLFPKSKFPQFALNPENLIPTCLECNQREKLDKFFESPADFKTALKDLGITEFKHPIKLWQNVKIDFNISLDFKLNIPELSKGMELLKFYGLDNRYHFIFRKCYGNLFNIIKHSDIRSPESLEMLIESLSSSTFEEMNDGYSLNNSPKIWHEFLEWVLFSENNLLALWEEVKDYSTTISSFQVLY